MTVKESAARKNTMEVSVLERKLIDRYQKSFPFCERPYAKIAQELGETEEAVLSSLKKMRTEGILSRVGPVFAPNSVGVSCLAALKLEEENLDAVADLISALDFINHNYEREHEYNLWFVITAKDQGELLKNIKEIEGLSGLDVLVLPLEQEYFIDLGFDIPWGAYGE